MGRPASFVNADVVLDGEPVIGSFTVDGLTFAVIDGSTVELVGVSNPEASDSTSVGSATEADDPVLMLPESVAYNDAEYAVTSIGAYAFYLSGVTSVELPASAIDVDDRAFRSSDVASVTVAEGNPTYSSFDGALYSADRSSLLLIPEGKQGAVLLPKETEVVEAGKFSHCSLVEAISAEDGAAFASENGLLYDASLTTLLRVPAGATDITIREGCTAIAAGAMEGCAKLATINAPASVASISPDIFTSVPTVSLPAASLAEDVPQLTALIALSFAGDEAPMVEASGIMVAVPEYPYSSLWNSRGFSLVVAEHSDVGSEGICMDTKMASSYAASRIEIGVLANNSKIVVTAVRAGSSFSVNEERSSFSSSSVGDKYTLTLNSNGTWRMQIFGSDNTTMHDYSFRTTSTYGLSFKGWSTSLTGTVFSSKTVQGTLSSNNPYKVYPVWNDKFTVSFNANGGSGGQSSNVTATYAANMPAISTTKPTRTGYTFGGWYDTSASSGGTQYYTAAGASARTWNKASNDTLYARWNANNYTIAFDSQYGSAVASVTATYNADVTLPTSTTRQGYVLKGWNTKADGSGASYQAGVVLAKPNLATSGTVTLYAQWAPVVSADVPMDVTAQVDLLGIEQQKEAQGYIESRCGEPLTVASIELSPLSGATELFGAANVADVALEVLAAGSASPDARFALDASASQAPAAPADFRMASYGDRVPISYRFDIPDVLLPTLVETTKPVCSVAYTVELA